MRVITILCGVHTTRYQAVCFIGLLHLYDNKYYHYSHFADGKTEDQFWSGIKSSKWQREILSPGHWPPKPKPLTTKLYVIICWFLTIEMRVSQSMVFLLNCIHTVYGCMSSLWVLEILGFSALCLSYWILMVSMCYFKVNWFGFLIMKYSRYLYTNTRTNTTRLHTHHSDLTNTISSYWLWIFNKENIPE